MFHFIPSRDGGMFENMGGGEGRSIAVGILSESPGWARVNWSAKSEGLVPRVSPWIYNIHRLNLDNPYDLKKSSRTALKSCVVMFYSLNFQFGRKCGLILHAHGCYFRVLAFYVFPAGGCQINLCPGKIFYNNFYIFCYYETFV